MVRLSEVILSSIFWLLMMVSVYDGLAFFTFLSLADNGGKNILMQIDASVIFFKEGCKIMMIKAFVVDWYKAG